ncbi:MAG: hypothetical protein MJ120_01900 [Clostridia bacterium]|nr:hypothetical protein [Clostridia bacterium]
MKKRTSKISDIAKGLDIPEDICSDGFHIELFSDTVIIDGCKNVAEYGDGCIKLNVGKKCIGVFGDELTIKSYICSQVIISGKIVSLELE